MYGGQARPPWLALSSPALPGNSGPMLPAGLPLCRRFSHCPVVPSRFPGHRQGHRQGHHHRLI